jgi:hypothetical protein
MAWICARAALEREARQTISVGGKFDFEFEPAKQTQFLGEVRVNERVSGSYVG